MAFIVVMYDGKYTYFTTVCCLFIINLLELSNIITICKPNNNNIIFYYRK